MSRRTVLWRKRIGSKWTVKGKGGSRELHSGNGGSLDGIIPDRVVKGRGTYLRFQDAEGQPNDFGIRGAGKTVTLPMNPETEERVRRLIAKK